MAILPIDVSYSLTDPPWKPASGPQSSVGGPVVYSHIAFVGGHNGGNMIIVGGVMPMSEKSTSDDETTAYSYDCDVGRWNSFTLPSYNYLNRQGAASSIWGGKRAVSSTSTAATAGGVGSKQQLPANMYLVNSLYPSNSTMASTTTPMPPLRYGHTQTLINDKTIVILGGFDSLSGEAVSLADIWLYDIDTNEWSHLEANYGGYDGYHVYNDVAVLDTRTWTWTIKNTNAAVQGRADHTATMVGTNMIVAFGFTGVSTALTVMSDIEVLDTVTWSWTSVYSPSSEYGSGGSPNRGIGKTTAVMPSTPSMAIVAGAVTGVLVVLVFIIVALYMFNYHQQRRKKKHQQNLPEHHFPHDSLPPPADDIKETTTTTATTAIATPSNSNNGGGGGNTMVDLPRAPTQLRIDPYYHHRHHHHHHQQQQQQQQHTILPSPWTPTLRQSFPPASSEWAIRRAATTPHRYLHDHNISKPDEPSSMSSSSGGGHHHHHPLPRSQIRRAATTPHAASSKPDTSEENDSLFDQQEFVLRSADEHTTVIDDDGDDDALGKYPSPQSETDPPSLIHAKQHNDSHRDVH
ncbi:hypothetical protein RO3G_09099 [Lichtheimia corymbifera JMRC:FSU:9682]|uniref:Galactose oxidase n=1 Tax=Lichtheimia corymbifera JMRC:FSU:9682 TaxID=1263082 RepID=A0A068SEF8_9FUNG|nr:hypothetical protein RO3G_09099 [Lichtheimia corymbifera JMRC:FSU:9682]